MALREIWSTYEGAWSESDPGVRIVTNSFEQHHDACLVKWTMQDGAKNALANGVTCGEIDGNGRLTKATVFYDLPAGAS